MSPIDDPVIPDDLRQLLRSGSADLDVAPADIRSVERRARQRRRRRHGVAAGGAALVLVVAGLAAVQLAGSDGSQTVTATDPPAPKGSVPQPVLVPQARDVAGFVVGSDPDGVGGALDAVTASGATTWWTTEGQWYPSSGFVMADGRRFGIAAANPFQVDAPPEARLDEIGSDGASISSRPIPLDAPDGYEESVRAIGATGNELIVQRSTMVRNPGPGEHIEESTSYAAIDVDTGTERPLTKEDGNSAAAAAGDVLVLAPGTDCTLQVTTLEGADPRTLDGGCDGTVEGLGGLATTLALSPDGRFAAVGWMTISRTGPGTMTLTVVDLEDGRILHRSTQAPGLVNQFAWTGERELTLSMEPEGTPVDEDVDGVAIRTITWDTIYPITGN